LEREYSLGGNVFVFIESGGHYCAKSVSEYNKQIGIYDYSLYKYAYENGKAERINRLIKNNYLEY
jgi:hypothetical protein